MRFALALGLAAVLAVAATASARDTAQGVPHGFRPETAAAVGTRDYWIFGDYRCSSGWCLALVRSTNGGGSFARVAAPPLTSQGTVPTLVFANARDGYAYTWTASPLYVTHDGGTTWHRTSGGSSIGVAAADREVYAVSGHCSDAHGCRSFHLRRSSVVRTGWRSLALPVRSGLPFSLAAHADHLWLLGETNSAKHRLDRLARSMNGGRTFTVRSGPCFADLGGRIVPAGDGVLWAVCPSGMMSELLLSTNGGRSFAVRSFHDPGGLGHPSLTNGAQVAAASARVAVLNGGGGGALLRTTDAGRHWNRVPLTARIEQVFWLGFTTHRVGVAVVQEGHKAQLLRTTDGGAIWHLVPIG
jgi:hypothetical protein